MDIGDLLPLRGGAPLRPALAVAVGSMLVALAAVVGALFGNETDRTIPALLLAFPGIAAAVIGGVRAAVPVAAEGAVTFAFFLPPRGSVRVHASEDLVALVCFVLVALVAGWLVSQVVSAQLVRAATLEAIEQQRRGLLRAVSHDLRTPLTVIRAASSELVPDDVGPGRRVELAELVVDEAERLDRLVANLLNLSRIEAGALRPVLQPVDVNHLVESALGRLRRLTRDVTIDATFAEDAELVAGDAVQLEQVITNLVENAVRYTPVGGTVSVDVERTATGVRVRVADRGRGLPSVDPDTLFAPFTTVSDGGSSGVGLAICRAIVEAHGGMIHGRNRDGGGAELLVELPRHAGQDPRRR